MLCKVQMLELQESTLAKKETVNLFWREQLIYAQPN